MKINELEKIFKIINNKFIKWGAINMIRTIFPIN